MQKVGGAGWDGWMLVLGGVLEVGFLTGRGVQTRSDSQGGASRSRQLKEKGLWSLPGCTNLPHIPF